MQNADDLLSSFKNNLFVPSTDSSDRIPDCAGNYIMCLQHESKLPSIGIEPLFKTFESLNVIYTGISGDSLQRRDYKKHFTGNNAGQSTLRKSLGVMFGYRQIPQGKNPRRTKFCREDEQQLTEWIRKNLVMFYLVHLNYRQIESDLIKHLNPPLNLLGNHNPINIEFRKLLSQLRCKRA